jgi:eukaryotic-like serine/threonine-protein kinase
MESVNGFTFAQRPRGVTAAAIRLQPFVYTPAGFVNGVPVGSKPVRFSWLPGGLAAVVVIAIGRLIAPDSFAPLELAIYDRAQRTSKPPVAKDLVLIDIDERSIAELGAWPWPRSVHADLLNVLHDSDARVVAFTVPFGPAQASSETERVRAALALLEASDLGSSDQAVQLRALLKNSENAQEPDAQLADAIHMHGNVVLPVELRSAGEMSADSMLPSQLLPATNASAVAAAERAAIVRPLSATLVNAASAVGHVHLPTDRDGTVRSDLTGMSVGTSLLPSLATAIAARALDVAPDRIVFRSASPLLLGDREVTLDPQLRSRPRYLRSNSSGLTHYSYSQVLAGKIPPAELQGRIILVGLAEPDASVATPVSRTSSPNVVIASGVAGIMNQSLYARPAAAIVSEWAVMAGVILFAAFVLPAAGIGLGALATVLVAAILAIADVGLLSSIKVWVQLLVPAVAALAGFGMYTLSEWVRRANIKAGGATDPTANLRTLGQTFQRQGQLDLAFETYRRCPLDAPTMELLYYLGMDFERRRQNPKAAAVYIATRDPNYRDLHSRRVRVKDEPVGREAPLEHPKPRSAPPRRIERPREDWSEEPFEERPATGRKLGRYEIERELGKGAMGVVYLGRDPNINRIVAIKAIPLADQFEEQDLEEARARFFREAEMAGRLNHPAIVTVYDAGEDQGLAYIAMEYLRGQHLSHFADNARLLPPHKVMTLVARTAEALDYAHRQNVVHRDIKPANIMFNPDTDELKITDFGIARLTDTSRTKTGIVLGTPSFMSPEQLEGRSLDGRSDQFALGVSLYQLLTGQLPFRAESMPRLMQKIATEPHTRIRLVRPELPEAIDALVDRALAKSADDRYPGCAQFAADLRACASSLEPKKSPTEHEWLLP